MTPIEGALKIISLIRSDMAIQNGHPSKDYMLKVLDHLEDVLTK